MKKKTVAILASSAGAVLAVVGITIGLKSHEVVDEDVSGVAAAEQMQEITWPEITADGVDEELLLQNVDEELLKEIAYELQTLVSEAAEEERQDPEIVIREGWTRVWHYERYQKVLNMGKPAMKPLYLIVYKSPYAGEYEYLCANILYELSGYEFEWSNSKEFLEKFNEAIIEQKGEKMAINVTVGGESYIAKMEDNATARAFLQKLPQELEMTELNGNEKYANLGYSLPTNALKPERIEAGDIMLYGDDCLVIFYKTFVTNYSYTKIGHIDNLPELNVDSVEVKIWK